MAAPQSLASLTGRPMPAAQSNLIAPWLRKVIQQTIVANARARPTSGQTRSKAVNTTPHPCFLRSPSVGCLYLRRLCDGQRISPLRLQS
jgi:hypothetical protein